MSPLDDPSSECLANTFSVLLVEDDALQRMCTAEELRAIGLDVVEAVGIDGAITALEGHPGLRAMVADVDLAGEPTAGILLARAVALRWPELAILVASGRNEPMVGQLPAGTRFLRKPYDVRELAGVMRSLVEHRT